MGVLTAVGGVAGLRLVADLGKANWPVSTTELDGAKQSMSTVDWMRSHRER